ncbi:Crp/Fnr family transcriptional regulator [Streptomyces sp. PT12]|uniref:Crp/Fnr family transcriptional regulator n=1 Tax=Streptomyces sp. PT12 TaxID=1510197 RepID=UPI000DE3B163|nr:Crp/Fnr family transcriptional regulator [Streptomyces sp. PT12]RBM06915.1 transcriptional regulator [Streptomyces sp. PT12]
MTDQVRWAGQRTFEDGAPFLARLEPKDADALRALGHRVQYRPRDVVLRQDDPSAHALILEKGWTKVTVSAANGYEALLALRGPGDLIGESAGFSEQFRAATVTALEEVTAVTIERETFIRFVRSTAQVAYQLAHLASDRQRTGDRRRLELAALDVRQRLAVVLLELAAKHGRPTAEGIEITIPLSQQELAGAVGSSREAVSRLYRELRGRGIIRTGRRAIVILQHERLRRIASVV